MITSTPLRYSTKVAAPLSGKTARVGPKLPGPRTGKPLSHRSVRVAFRDPKSAGDREAQPATPPQRIASDADHTAVNALRILSMDMVDVADAGHLGAPLGLAPAAFVLWTEFATFSPSDPAWPNRDRIVFSCGHACALQYAALHLAGYDLPRAELQRLCKIGSRTPGHPENLLTPGIEVTTGPLGQGLANAVGFAIAERHLAARAPAPGLVDHRTWVFASDGDLMEGISYEASSLAGHLGLDKLTVLYDANGSTIDGSTRLAFTEDVAQRFGAQGWHVQRVRGADTDLDAIRGALRAATMSTSDAAAHESESRGKPRLVILETTLGYGSPKAGDHHIHSHPLTPEDAAATRKNLAWAVEEPFVVPEAARAPFTAAAQRGESRAHAWKERVRELAAGSPRESGRQDEHEKGDKAPWSILDWVSGSGSAGKEGGSGGTTSTVSTPPAGWAESLPTDTAPFQVHGASPQALRKTSGLILNHLAQQMGGILAGSADLASSNVTYLNDAGGDFSRENPAGRNLRFGIREHAMTAIANGIALHGSGLRPVASTFTVFTDYLKPALRLAALSGAPTVLVCTHDSVGVGEDGPTHQPIEQLAGLRAIPHLSVLRPADAEELIGCYQSAFDRTDGPTLLVLPRQAVPNLMGTQREGPGKGAYVVYQTNAAEGPNLVLLASGSEVDLAIKAAQDLEGPGTVPRTDLNVRVVSVPSLGAFLRQPPAYRDEIIPRLTLSRVAIEASNDPGWFELLGAAGQFVGVRDGFGLSGPGEEVYEAKGMTVARVRKAALQAILAEVRLRQDLCTEACSIFATTSDLYEDYKS